ncbi:integral membrane protein, putative [Talaromyces stipitatus ATCC 10500]|uniref:Integral membrane protein, putative n=1 Tax=Talaromyces stipitatus (strain ATCC 10500 / CBS 375.48 / QM 6759 / NRRL 1006) TaxID=441959 RepID=B8LZX3_TALSN|nr:integral membrane protein, putative [Talaromyces stipitatus ATCC 10500]EED20905.1 integral membrane protein, putative [Talaromyces stipitatus ATCC 10500]
MVDVTSPEYLAQSKVASIIVCNAILISCSGVAMAVRLFVRSRFLSGIGWDDSFCLIGYIFTFVECLVCILMTNYGYGHHIQTILQNEHKMSMFLKLDFVTEITYLIALWAVKVSFGLFYLKIFPGRTIRVLCWILIILVTAEWIEETFVVIFQCSPVQKAWDASGKVSGKCLQLLSFYYISFAVRLATDLAIFILPLPELLRLKMPLGKRLGLILMFGLGLLIVVTSIIRATYLNNFSTDHTWELVNPLNWSSVEIGVGVFIACVPSFKALITFCFPSLKHVLGLSSDRSYGPQYELYGASGRRTDDPRSWHGKSQNNTKLNTITRTNVEASRNTSEERIISHTQEGIHVTTDVSVDRVSKPVDTHLHSWHEDD